MDHEQHTDGDAMATNAVVKSTIGVELRKDLERIDSLRELADDWNTYGGVPATVLAAASASDLLRSLVSDDERPRYTLVRPHSIAPLASGGLNLEWRGPHGEMTVEVYPDGRLGCYVVESHDGETIERDEENTAIANVYASLRCILGIQ